MRLSSRHFFKRNSRSYVIPAAFPLSIVMDGCQPFDEDTWATVSLRSPGGGPGVTFRGVKPCSRCKVTTTDQATAEVGKEPLVVS